MLSSKFRLVGTCLGATGLLYFGASSGVWCDHSKAKSRLIFLGTGNSTGSPIPRCVFPSNANDPACATSLLAMKGQPEENPNYRCNPCLMIETPTGKFVQIDVGKTFRESMVRWYPRRNIKSVDAVILTHDHADAIMGLDDLRGFQSKAQTTGLPIFLSQHTYQRVSKAFSYLVPRPKKTLPVATTKETSKPKVFRWIAKLDWNIIAPFHIFFAGGLGFMPIPVLHGEDYESLGFCFGEDEKVVYISDVSQVPKKTEDFIRMYNCDILIIDALFREKKHKTHFSVHESLDFIARIQPTRCAYLVGTAVCDSGNEHREINLALKNSLRQSFKINCPVIMAHDGLEVDVAL